MRASGAMRLILFLALTWLATGFAVAQQSGSSEEIPLSYCDLLPVVTMKIESAEMRFLVDTGATSILNLKSFSTGNSRQIHVSSWSGTAATSAREVSLPELRLGSHALQNVKLPAIDLSPIGKACGGQIDGILGVDLLDQLSVSIDLKRRVVRLEEHATTAMQMAEMMKAMEPCNRAFDRGEADELEKCFDEEIVLYTPWGEFRGRHEVMKYLKEHFLKFAPNLHYEEVMHDARRIGDALWYTYDYRVEVAGKHVAGHGMAMCRRQNGKWQILNLHNSLLQPESGAGPETK